MKQKGFTTIIILTLLLTGIVGYFAYKNYISPKGTILGPYLPSPVASLTPDPTANWKMYNKLSFSVKAPQQLLYNEKASGKDSLGIGEALPVGKTPERGIDITFGYLYGNEIVKCATNNDCYNNLNTSIKGGEAAGSKTITTQISAMISEQTISGFRQLDLPTDTFNLTQIKIIYPLSHNGNLFEIRFNAFGKSESEINEYLELLNINQILSTFKFTDSLKIPSIIQQELDLGWYWGLNNQKKPGTPDNWIFNDAGRSSCWHKPGVNCAL